ncbi:exopolysaccharide production repressor protein [Mesorhizobium sp. SP-1A]|jgi:hypothetical protein|uniref:exopolysaccharide production repressor protein n=1 Tax=Mesorhizobium sp. SP-1A TaxID=3077840 RepID=UPI0028F71E54|nr:exopolysaccharide production repressor protein [Mesorhizobium sp. SP-1A]
MSFLLFLRGFVIALAAFAIATYAITQSFWTTFVNTVICAVLIQLGYFVAILFLVWRSGAPGKRSGATTRNDGGAVAEDAKAEGKAAPLPGVGRSTLP